MIEVRAFNGKLNVDDNPYRTPQGDYIDALNITRDSQGDNQDEVVSLEVGNQLVEDTLPGDVNVVIGNYADRVRNRQYFFTYNDQGYNRISYYDAYSASIVIVMEDLTDTNGIGVLNFDPSWKINHIDIIYRDEEGDLLFWTDGLNPPRKINVETALIGGYGIIQSSYLDVAKEPPSAPPYCVYEDDNTVNINNLQNKQFKFKYRFVFDDFEKSVTSAQSEVPIPVYYSEQSTVVDPTKNADIFMVLQTGAPNVKKIEVLGAESLGVNFSDFFLITTLDKSKLAIPDNDICYYRFYNNETYSPIPLQESIQPFDNVPQRAYTQSLPNGNVLDYGAITEGYDNPDLAASAYGGNTINSAEYKSGLMVLSYQNNQPAFGGNNSIRIIVAGVVDSVTNSSTVNVEFTVGVFPITTTVTISATAIAGVDNITSVLNKLITSALANGFTIASITDANSITISGLANAELSRSYIDSVDKNLPSSNSVYANDWSSRYSYGVVYFDEKGRTNGAVTNIDSATEMASYDEVLTNFGLVTLPTPKIPNPFFSIESRPPDWASYFEVVRTKNLSKSNFLYWISLSTYKDTIPSESGYLYAYIDISSLTDYIVNNPDIKSLGYEFTPGDRIRFVKSYNKITGLSQIYQDKDFEILAVVANPAINGAIKNGSFLKILLPPTSATFDFGTLGFYNYLYEVYSPAPNFSSTENLFYEFGQRYIIVNPGQPDRFHQGMNQNQTPDLSQFATFSFPMGDSYFRYRTYPFSGTMKFSSNPGNINPNGFNGGTLISSNSNTPEYTPYPYFTGITNPNNQRSFLEILDTTKSYTFRIKGTIVFKTNINCSGIVLNIQAGSPSGDIIIKAIGVYNLVTGVPSSYYIEDTFTVPTTYQYVYLNIARLNVDPQVDGVLESFDFSIVENNFVYQGIIDPNLTDTSISNASVNGRAWKYDLNAANLFNPTLIRFGGEFQAGTPINQINRFYEENFDVYDRSRGSIKKMFIEGRNQYIFQEFDVGVVTVLTQIVRDTAGNPLSAQSDNLLNKIVYPYIGQYGIGNVPESFAYGKHAKYFVDDNKGVVCRLSVDGITPLSITYKMNAFFVPKLNKFKEALSYPIPTTGRPTVYGAYDAFTNKYVIALSEIYDDNTLVQEPYTISFLESRDPKQGFESFLSFHPENIGTLNNLLISFKNGNVWTHNNPLYSNFFGNQFPSSITVSFNNQPLDKKTFLAIMQTASSPWSCPLIQSQANTYGNTKQQTNLVEARFVELEGQYHSAILRDINSPGGIINGDSMKGNYLIVKFQKNDSGNYYYLNTVSLRYIDSPLNAR